MQKENGKTSTGGRDEISSSESERLRVLVDERECPSKSYTLKYPTFFEKASGIYLFGKDGKCYVDCLNGFGVNILGHNHPVLQEAALDFVRSGAPFQIIDLMSPIRDEFIDLVFSLFPEDMRGSLRIQFTGGSGSDAVETAIELARKHTGRSMILAFSGAYHGLTAGSMGLTGNEIDKTEGSGQLNVQHLPFPTSGIHSPFGEADTDGSLSARYIEGLLLDQKRGFAKPAAVIIELVQSDAGIIVAPVSFVKELRRMTSEMGILLIVDEVQTGFGKTGKMFSFEHYGIRPDIITVSKAFGAGMPLSAVIFDKRINIACTKGTFRGNQIAMALGIAQFKYVQDNYLLSRVPEIEKKIAEKLSELKRFSGSAIVETRHSGIMFAVELSDSKTAARVHASCFENGLLCKLGGRGNRTLIFWTNLLLNSSQITEIFARLTLSLKP